MKKIPFKLSMLCLVVSMVGLASSCNDPLTPETPVSESMTYQSNATTATVADLPGRTLAANCFQCHGTNGYGLEHLAGKSANSIISEMREMQAKNPRSEIMNVHAKAYTTEEIKLIADFFSKQ